MRTTDAADRPMNQSRRWSIIGVMLGSLGLLAVGMAYVMAWNGASAAPAMPTPAATLPHANTEALEAVAQEGRPPVKAPELDGGFGWLNCGGPIRMKDLKGKVVLLDFWTYCCINCIHVMPDLAKLEKKYANQLVVIGVHSAKFDTERDSQNIREAILRYNIEHPVVNDADHKIWDAYAVRSWPTFWLIDPEGNLFKTGSGEGLLEALDENIDLLVKLHKMKKTLNEEPIRFDLAKFKERPNLPLYFPGKVLADAAGKRLFISDSTHHRIVVTDLDGKKLDVIGTGRDGMVDGTYAQAQFNDPQGLALRGETLYVADRKNHLIRAIDLTQKKVTTIAGTGEQGYDRRTGGPARSVGLNSPWDLWLHQDSLYVAMAGHHQIWRMSLKTNGLEPYAGSGREDIFDGPLLASMFAQCSGLTSDGKTLYVADSEVSAVRAVPLDGMGEVTTLVGRGLFDFGDVDGAREFARLQHALGVAYHGGKVYVADTYNNKIKAIDLATKKCQTFLGDGKPGKSDNPPRFDEPAGLSVAGDVLYVADTNNHAIRVIDLKSKAVRTLTLTGVEPPAPPVASSKPVFPSPTVFQLPATTTSKDGPVTLHVQLELPSSYKLNADVPLNYLLEGITADRPFEQQGKIEPAKTAFDVQVPAGKLASVKSLKVSVAYLICQQGSEGICQLKSAVWEVPLRLTEGAKETVISLANKAGSK